MIDLNSLPHKRLNILTGEWVLVSPHRSKRPWQGKVETPPADERPAYDAACYLCPGNKRADGGINPSYQNAFSFVNDYSALLQNTPAGTLNDEDLLVAKNESGICKVICFSPRHDLTLPEMTIAEIQTVIALWQKEYASIAADPSIRYIQIFENKGEIMGCSNPHPHGQIWASSGLPMEIVKETEHQRKHFEKKGRSLLSDYTALEMNRAERIVLENEHFVALVPFWAVWPFETMIVSKRHLQNITQFSEEEKQTFASILKGLTTKYDNLFGISFPYSAGMHQSPINDGEHPGWHWHMHFYPPLLRSATVKKFMVGYEMLANPQRDITPEWAAQKLRESSTIHYKQTQNERANA